MVTIVDWSVFRKILDGTVDRLNHLCIDVGSAYDLMSESWGGMILKCTLPKTDPRNADQEDYEENFKNAPMKSRRTEDGLPRQASEKPSDPKSNSFSINLCDKTTWFPDSERITDELLVPVGLTAQLQSTLVIDLTHGKITNEDLVVGTHGLVVKRADDTVMKERDMHFQNLVLLGKITPAEEPPYDYECNYATGLLTFQEPPPPGAKATYSRARTSKTIVEPPAGQDLQIISVEVNFSNNVEMLDTVIFQPHVYNPSDPPNKVPYGAPIKYKTVWDLIAESNGACPEIPSICSPDNMRGMGGFKARILNWKYATKTPLNSAVGAELRISLEHDFPFDGKYAVVTFYGVLRPSYG